jgi:Fe-S cluster biogenesis protein NfuA
MEINNPVPGENTDINMQDLVSSEHERSDNNRFGGQDVPYDHEIQIFSQWTPNPNAFKFITSEFVVEGDRVGFANLEECADIPLAKALLSLDGVTQVHFFENVTTVTQDGSQDWGELSESVEVALQQWLPSHDAKAVAKMTVRDISHFTDEMHKVDEILSREIRPALQGDGGDLELVALKDGILSIRYQGACGSCPSSMAGTLSAIVSILRAEYNQDIEVVVV